MDLAKIRKDPKNLELFTPNYVRKLAQKYDYATNTDQDFYFLLQYENPTKVSFEES